MNDFEKAMDFRHACKLFDETKTISSDDFYHIIEAGRKSPSSFGLEPWHFLVITDDKIKNALRPQCWDQPQVTSCSHFVVLLSRKPKFFELTSSYLDEAFSRRAKDPEKRARAKAMFEGHIQNEMKPNVEDWAKMQCYIASANMMTAAAYIGIDSCPIEGFSYEGLTEALRRNVTAIDWDDFDIAYCVAFGYRVNPQSVQVRWPLEKVSTFI